MDLTTLVRSACYVNEKEVQDAIGASYIYRSLKRKDVTIRKSLDCLVTHAAIKNGLPLLHRDRDFDIITKHTKLKLIRV